MYLSSFELLSMVLMLLGSTLTIGCCKASRFALTPNSMQMVNVELALVAPSDVAPMMILATVATTN